MEKKNIIKLEVKIIMSRLIIRDTVPAYTRHSLFYMPEPFRSDEYAATARTAINAGKFLVAIITPESVEAQYVSALDAEGSDKVEPYYERAISREDLRRMLEDFSRVPATMDVELRLQPQNEAYVLGLVEMYPKTFNLTRTTVRTGDLQ